MNKIELQDNGFPFRAQSVRFLQKSYQEAISNLAKVHGENYILWGCEQNGSIRTAGAIVVNGEVIPFIQSPANERFTIEESVENATYKGGLVVPAYYTRVAKCSSTGAYYFSDFKRAVYPEPAVTEWQSVIFANDYEDEASYGLFWRVGEGGKGLLVGTYERKDDRSYPESAGGDIYFSGEVFEICQTGFKPLKTQYVQIYRKGYIYNQDKSQDANMSKPFVYNVQQMENFANIGVPCLGWIEPDGILRAKFDKVSRGFNIYKTGYVCAEIELL